MRIAIYGAGSLGFPTPANDKVVEVIRRIERGELKPGFDNLKYFG